MYARTAFRTATRTPEPAAEAHDDDERADYALHTVDNEYHPDLQSPDDAFRSRDERRLLLAAAASLQLRGEAHADRLRSEIIAVEPRYRGAAAATTITITVNRFPTCPRQFRDVLTLQKSPARIYLPGSHSVARTLHPRACNTENDIYAFLTPRSGLYIAASAVTTTWTT